MHDLGAIKPKFEIEAIRAVPREGMTLEELEVKMAEIGNVILEKNVEGNYLLLKHNFN